jgi:hypothetical protein
MDKEANASASETFDPTQKPRQVGKSMPTYLQINFDKISDKQIFQ